MLLKNLINKSWYSTIGYIAKDEDLEVLEQYILYNLPVLKEFQNIIIATNYNGNYQQQNAELWNKYFPDCIIIDNPLNRGHNHGYIDLDNIVFDYCKENNIEWLCKSANDVIFKESLLDKEIGDADFYYFNGISYEDLYLNNFDYKKIYDTHFYPQTNFYFIKINKIDYLYDKQYIEDTYKYSLSVPNYNNKIWEYIPGWSCENFLKNCVTRNCLSKEYLLNLNTHEKLCNAIKLYKIGDPSHKNIMYEGVCHFQYPEQNIIEI
jgi:hypothetical protein